MGSNLVEEENNINLSTNIYNKNNLHFMSLVVYKFCTQIKKLFIDDVHL